MAATRCVCPPWLRPESAPSPAETTIGTDAPAEATHRAVNADTLSPWSEQRISAASIGSGLGNRQARASWCATGSVDGAVPQTSATIPRSTAAPARRTDVGERLRAAGSRASSSARRCCRRARSGSLDALARRLGGSTSSGHASHKSPITSSKVCVSAKSDRSCPRTKRRPASMQEIDDCSTGKPRMPSDARTACLGSRRARLPESSRSTSARRYSRARLPATACDRIKPRETYA